MSGTLGKCGCVREGDRWKCAGQPASECAAVAAAGSRVRRFAPGEREVDLVELTWQKSAAAKRKIAVDRARRSA